MRCVSACLYIFGCVARLETRLYISRTTNLSVTERQVEADKAPTIIANRTC